MCQWIVAQKIDDWEYRNITDIQKNIIRSEFQFNGYTNYWHDIYREWIYYGNLFKTAVPNIESTIVQSKVDVAEDLGISGLYLQEGFFNGLIASAYTTLDQPSVQHVEEALANGNVLVLVDSDSETGQRLSKKFRTPHTTIKEKLKSHQYNAKSFVEVNAFILENGDKKLFVISSTSQEMRNKLKRLIDSTKELLQKYDLHKGWFGAKTLTKSVTCTPGHYMDVMGKGMNEGVDWFIFDGYMDFLSQKELDVWVGKANLPVVVDVGTPPIYGCDNYDGLQVQGNYTREMWIQYAHERGGYVFRNVFDTLATHLQYDGYIAYDSRELGYDGNKEQIDNENIPFVCPTLELDDDAIPCMVIFTPKEPLTKKNMWDAIMNRREVAILENGKMMGPAQYRHTLDLLLLDRVFIEEYWGGRINIEAFVEDYKLNVILTNTYSHDLTGKLEIVLSPELKLRESGLISQVNLPTNSIKKVQFDLQPLPEAMEKINPIALHYTWGNNKKSTVTMLDLPPFISVHQLLYGHTPKVVYPVTIHNFSDNASFPVHVEVFNIENPRKVVYKSATVCTTPTGTFKDLSFDLKLPPGNYWVKVMALGLENISQMGVGTNKGVSILSEVDLNNDGIKEYRMENDSVQVTLLAVGARVIEYIVKSRKDNILFKLWPEKAIDDSRAFRKRGYYPYGGFEDFLGQGSMETHQIYDVEILKNKGDYVQVKMTADYFGNKLEKIFTLYGNSPLLEIRFALTFRNPEANVIGPQPILELGAKHWTEDIFTVPGKDGLQEFVMEPERTFGRVLYLKEGWNAGYDTEEDVSFIGAFPVTEPLFLHMWMNHPRNRDAHYYYVEFQPWTPIYQKSTMYFEYYIWGEGGHWKNGLKELRDRNLISVSPQ
jgi:hypothetical protein